MHHLKPSCSVCIGQGSIVGSLQSLQGDLEAPVWLHCATWVCIGCFWARQHSPFLQCSSRRVMLCCAMSYCMQVGAPRWLACIVTTWGVTAMAFAFSECHVLHFTRGCSTASQSDLQPPAIDICSVGQALQLSLPPQSHHQALYFGRTQLLCGTALQSRQIR
jgi:hypothetical protein